MRGAETKFPFHRNRRVTHAYFEADHARMRGRIGRRDRAARAGATSRRTAAGIHAKPIKLPGYGRNKPITHLSEVLAKHKGQSSWTEQVIKTDRFDTRWVQMAPGEKLSTRYYGDDRVMWVVWQGQIRFNIEGQEPFVASKGFLVQVPQRVRYSMETVGSEPALRYEVTRAGQLPNFPADNGEAKPPNAPDGTEYVKVSTPTAPDKYEGVNKPYVDFFKDVVAKDRSRGPTRPW
jgi:mannose-6-phosphate isomerase-like protein (cupin superfamily)